SSSNKKGPGGDSLRHAARSLELAMGSIDETPTVVNVARFANPEAERALLGALANSGCPDDLARLDREDFTTEASRVLFDAIARRLANGDEISLVLLADDVRGAGISSVAVYDMLEEAGASVPAYVPLLRDCRLRRLLHSLGACLTAHAMDAAREPQEIARW